jgi:hypothetical protein
MESTNIRPETLTCVHDVSVGARRSSVTALALNTSRARIVENNGNAVRVVAKHNDCRRVADMCTRIRGLCRTERKAENTGSDIVFVGRKHAVS